MKPFVKKLLFKAKGLKGVRSEHASLRAVYGPHVKISHGTIVDDDVSIGDFSFVNANSSLEKCSIGRYCSISSNVHVCPFEYPQTYSTSPFLNNDYPDTRQPVTIGSDVLVSLNVVILQGVTIGHGAIIGAGAVVTRDVQPFEVVGGVPAKHIRFRYGSETIHRLLESKYWELEPSQAGETYRAIVDESAQSGQPV